MKDPALPGWSEKDIKRATRESKEMDKNLPSPSAKVVGTLREFRDKFRPEDSDKKPRAHWKNLSTSKEGLRSQHGAGKITQKKTRGRRMRLPREMRSVAQENCL